MSGPELLSNVARPASDGAAQPSRRWALLGAVAMLTMAAAAVHFQAAAPPPDEVSAAESARRNTVFAAVGPLQLEQVAPDELLRALARSALPSADGHALALDAGSGRIRMVLLSVFDCDAEDGDVAEIRSAGFSQVVRLTRAPSVLAVPVGPDNMISIVGLVDGGGGGVTVGLVLPSGPTPLPPLSVGQVLSIPVGAPR